MTHALTALAHGNILGAMNYNALSVTLLPVVMIYLLFKIIQYVINGSEDFKALEIIFLLTCLGICFCYFLIRNNLI